MDIRAYNREKWNKLVENGNIWTIPVGPEEIAAARRGEWSVGLTEQKRVPSEWFAVRGHADLHGLEVLCLASGGGQQGPVLAAAGARVTVYDNSPAQLASDRMVAERDGLEIRTVEGDMRDLSAFAGESFDLIFHPVSNVFVPEVRPVWREAFRVLRRGGVLLAGFNNPAVYIFDYHKAEQGIMEVRYKLPFDSRNLSEEELRYEFDDNSPLEFSHMLEDQIGGQLETGFLLSALYEDTQPGLIGQYLPAYIATRAVKP